METQIATGIGTDIFYSIIEFLKDNDWRLTAEYNEEMFDKGIDFDLYEFSKRDETVLLVWDNWLEGEIKATTETLRELEKQFETSFNYGEHGYLKNVNIIFEMQKLLKLKK